MEPADEVVSPKIIDGTCSEKFLADTETLNVLFESLHSELPSLAEDQCFQIVQLIPKTCGDFVKHVVIDKLIQKGAFGYILPLDVTLKDNTHTRWVMKIAKFIREEFKQRFLKGSQIQQLLANENNAPRIFCMETFEQYGILIMERMYQDLYDYLASVANFFTRNHNIDLMHRQIDRLLAQMNAVLHKLYVRKIVHGDLHFGNLMYKTMDVKQDLMIIDFDAAHIWPDHRYHILDVLFLYREVRNLNFNTQLDDDKEPESLRELKTYFLQGMNIIYEEHKALCDECVLFNYGTCKTYHFQSLNGTVLHERINEIMSYYMFTYLHQRSQQLLDDNDFEMKNDEERIEGTCSDKLLENRKFISEIFDALHIEVPDLTENTCSTLIQSLPRTCHIKNVVIGNLIARGRVGLILPLNVKLKEKEERENWIMKIEKFGNSELRHDRFITGSEIQKIFRFAPQIFCMEVQPKYGILIMEQMQISLKAYIFNVLKKYIKTRDENYMHDRVKSIIDSIHELLTEFHVKNIIHRDFHLDNIMYKNDRKEHLYVIDFDMARIRNDKKQHFVDVLYFVTEINLLDFNISNEDKNYLSALKLYFVQQMVPMIVAQMDLCEKCQIRGEHTLYGTCKDLRIEMKSPRELKNILESVMRYIFYQEDLNLFNKVSLDTYTEL